MRLKMLKKIQYLLIAVIASLFLGQNSLCMDKQKFKRTRVETPTQKPKLKNLQTSNLISSLSGMTKVLTEFTNGIETCAKATEMLFSEDVSPSTEDLLILKDFYSEILNLCKTTSKNSYLKSDGQELNPIIKEYKNIVKIYKNKSDKAGEQPNSSQYEEFDSIKEDILKNKRDSLTSTDKDGQSLLILTCKDSQEDLVKFILEQYDDQEMVNAVCNDGKTALHWACQNKEWPIVEELIKHGAKKSIETVSKTKSIPLTIAIRMCAPTEIIKLFLKNLNNTQKLRELIKISDLSKNNPISYALKNNLTDIINLFLENNLLDINCNVFDDADCKNWGKNNKTLLTYAMENCSQNIVELLIEKGAQVKPEDLSLTQNQEIINLINYSLKLDQEFAKDNETLIEKLVKEDNLKAINRILNSNALNETNKKLLLLSACKLNKPQIIKLIVSKSCNQKIINATNSDNQTPLYLTCLNREWETAKLLVINGAKKSIAIYSNKNESAPACTPLALACKHDATPIIKLFLRCFDCRDIINLADQEGKTQLTYACENNNPQIINLLFSNGAQVTKEHKEIAKDPKIISFLEECLQEKIKNEQPSDLEDSIETKEKSTNSIDLIENKSKKICLKRNRNNLQSILTTSKGSTGRSIAYNQAEEKAMQLAKDNPTGYILKTVQMGDKRWPGKDGWLKMEQIVEVQTEKGYSEFVIIHYVHKDNSCLFDDFKFKNF